MPTQLNPYILGSGLFENSSSKMHHHKKAIVPKALTWLLHIWVVPIKHDHKCKTENHFIHGNDIECMVFHGRDTYGFAWNGIWMVIWD